MGLATASGGRGAKATLQRRFPQAFARAPGLTEVVGMLGQKRSECVALVDGNVALRNVPTSVNRLDDFVFFFYRSIFSAACAAETVIVVFDEPAAMTKAKEEECSRRDAARAKSSSGGASAAAAAPPPPSMSDNYTTAWLEAHTDFKSLMNNRAARSRFIDEVVKRAVARLQVDAGFWQKQGEHLRLVCDGVDPSGSDRDPGVPRVACLVGDEAVASVLRRDAPVGEGDVKLVAWADRVHRELHNASETFSGVKTLMHVTIDTDSFMLCLLLEESLNRAHPERLARDVICFREPAKKRMEEEDDEMQARPTYLLCDVSMLGQQLRSEAWPQRDHASEVSAADRERLVALVALAAALCGCDFILGGLNGANFDAALEAALRMARQRDHETIHMLDGIKHKSAEQALACAPLVEELCFNMAGVLGERPRMGKQANQVRQPEKTILTRAIWTASYWMQNEFKNTMDFGFVPLSG